MIHPIRAAAVIAPLAALLAALLTGLTGCSLLPSAVPPGMPPGAPLKAPDAGFALDGRISVVYGNQNLSGKIQWSHAPVADEINLASPLGTQVARLQRDADGVTLTDSERNVHRAADAETLTRQRLGWRLPLAGLTDWVRARPASTEPQEVRRDAEGRLELLAESGWRIEYVYDDSGATPSRLPRRLFMRYIKAEEPLEIRLVIDQWSVQ